MIPHTSLTHVHLLAALRAEVQRLPAGTPIRILDVGCGRGALIGYLHASFQLLEPQRSVELFGFDVSESGVQKTGFLEEGIQSLRGLYAGVNWEERLATVSANDPWPYPDASFDFIISNQVLEHVGDHPRFFAELYRVLKTNSVSLHCFPVKECVWEGHLLLPLVHWLAGHQERKAAIKMLSRLRLGLYPLHSRKTGISLDDFAEHHADFLNLYTNYLKSRQLLAILKHCRLRASYSYSGGLLSQKLRSILRRSCKLKYSLPSGAWLPLRGFWFFKRLSSITLRIEKADSYRNSV